MNEQVGFPYSHQQRRIPPQQLPIRQLPANPHRAGHYSGPHPKDQPYSSQAFASEETEYDDMVPVRSASSVRRYTATDNGPTQPSTRRRKFVVHQGPPPDRYTTRTQKREEHIASQKRRWRVHWLVFVGAALLLMVLGGMALNTASSWWNMQVDTWHYGTLRTYQTDAVVGHHDSPANPSHFIALNLHGRVEVIEIQGGEPTHSLVYVGPNVLGQNADLAPVTLAFADVNGDGRLDMEIEVLGQTIIFLNDGTKFVAPKQS